jgi:hypothetical protein
MGNTSQGYPTVDGSLGIGTRGPEIGTQGLLAVPTWPYTERIGPRLLGNEVSR